MLTSDDTTDGRYLAADAADAHAALQFAAQLAAATEGWPGADEWLRIADSTYRWLRQRDSIRAAAIIITPGTPRPEGTNPMATIFDLSDLDEVTFTLSAADAKGAPVDTPPDTWAWVLADPDATGAVLTVSADTLSAVVAAGTPDTTGTLLLTVTGATSGLTGAEAILVQASAAATVSLVPGTPTPEPPPSPPSA